MIESSRSFTREKLFSEQIRQITYNNHKPEAHRCECWAMTSWRAIKLVNFTESDTFTHHRGLCFQDGNWLMLNTIQPDFAKWYLVGIYQGMMTYSLGKAGAYLIRRCWLSWLTQSVNGLCSLKVWTNLLTQSVSGLCYDSACSLSQVPWLPQIFMRAAVF